MWLLVHICDDNELEFDSLQQATIMELFAKMLNQGALTLQLTAQAANLLIVAGITIGIDKLSIALQGKLLRER